MWGGNRMKIYCPRDKYFKEFVFKESSPEQIQAWKELGECLKGMKNFDEIFKELGLGG